MSNEALGRRSAEEFRAEFGLGLEPIVSMARLIERTMGIGVAYVDAPAPGHGMTMSHGGRQLIAVACTEHPMRLRSTLAHELGHLRLDSVDRYLRDGAWGERTAEEIQADVFARHLLVPLAAVTAAARDREPTQALLSDLVQTFHASPHIVAIQLREAKVIDQPLCSEWITIPAGRLASQFGWRTEYQALVEQTKAPRAPQSLLARAVEGYRWGIVTPAVIARLNGNSDRADVVRQLEAEGVVPLEAHDASARRPSDSGAHLTAPELETLMGDAD